VKKCICWCLSIIPSFYFPLDNAQQYNTSIFFFALSRKPNDTFISYVLDLCFDPPSLGIFMSNSYTVKIVSKSHKQCAAVWNNRVYEFLSARQDNFINITSTGTNKVSQSISISAQKLPSM